MDYSAHRENELTCEDAVLLDAHTETMFGPGPLGIVGPLLALGIPRGVRVLLVSGDRDRRRTLCWLLAGESDIQSVDHCPDTLQALERLEDELADVVILDLPSGLAGLDLITDLRESAPASTLIVTSAAPALEAAPAAISRGANCYLQHSRRRGTVRLASVLARFATAAA